MMDFFKRKFFLFPGVDDFSKIIRNFLFRSAEFHPSCFRCGDSLSLPFLNVFTLILRYKG